ncbi:hypothetical protein LJC42_00025 [Eubacteriales bacterium OttesenSCG-928-K08]|nr:hypothetical protein [Eubacteriales bacterium OttesenSCG-928-K08]
MRGAFGFFKARSGKLALALGVLLMLSGCKGQAQQTFAPSVEPTPSPTRTPAAEKELNPVAMYWETFDKAVEPIRQQMKQAAQADASYISKSLEFEQFLTRLQCFFTSALKLEQSSQNTWDGVVGGALGGSVSLTGDELSCTFTHLLWQEGRIVGQLTGNVLNAQWQSGETITQTPPPEQPDEPDWTYTLWTTIKSASIWLDENGGYCAAIWWEDEPGFLMVTQEDTLFFYYEVEQSSNVPKGEKGWCFENLEFTQIEPEDDLDEGEA